MSDKGQQGSRREDPRRLPLWAQVARIRQYHRDKIKHQGHCGMGDPFVTSDNIRKRFRVLCPEGLLRIYAREQAERGARNANLILLEL